MLTSPTEKSSHNKETNNLHMTELKIVFRLSVSKLNKNRESCYNNDMAHFLLMKWP